MPFRCQACGFQVYNRLYPFCESCKTELAPGIALSADERARRLAAQRELDERQRSERSRKAATEAGTGGVDLGDVLGGDIGCSGID